MRQWVSFVAIAAAVCLFCADSASALGRRGRSRGCSSCSSGYCGGWSGGGCSSCGSGWSGCSGGGCGTYAYAPSSSYCPTCAASASGTAMGSREATLVVNLPSSAKLAIDDYQTKSTSGQRVFQTPPLDAGKDFSYTLTAKVMRDGAPVTITKKVTVRAGETTRITLEMPAKSVASR